MKVPTRVFSRAFACALIALALAAGSAPVRADTVTVTAKGTVTPSCAVAKGLDFPPKSFNAPSSISATATITCNQTFKVTTTSANGSIKGSTPSTTLLANSLTYDLTANVVVDSGPPRTATCPSAQLTAGQAGCTLSPANGTGLTSNGQISTNKITTLTVSWGSARLVPGSYGDTLTLTIGAIP